MSYDPPPGPGQQPPYGEEPSGAQQPYSPYGSPSYGGQQPHGYGQPYGQQPWGAPPRQSGLAIASLVTGILGIFFCGCLVVSIAALVLGIFGKKEIRESSGAKVGHGMAQAGFILGIVGIAIGLAYWALVVFANVAFYEY